MPNYGKQVTKQREAFVKKYYGELGYKAEYCAQKLGMSVSGIEKVASRLGLQKRKEHSCTTLDLWVIAVCEDGRYLVKRDLKSFVKDGWAYCRVAHSLQAGTYTVQNKKKWHFSLLRDYRGYGWQKANKPDEYWEAVNIPDLRCAKKQLPERLAKKDAMLYAQTKLERLWQIRGLQ